MPAIKDDTGHLLSAEEAAEILGVTPGTLAVWRSTKRYDLPWVKVGRLIRYRLSDVTNWIDRRVENG